MKIKIALVLCALTGVAFAYHKNLETTSTAQECVKMSSDYATDCFNGCGERDIECSGGCFDALLDDLGYCADRFAPTKD
jgi:hypothetical protein